MGQFISLCLWLLFVIEEVVLSQTFLSHEWWLQLVELLGGEVQPVPNGVGVTASLFGVGILAGVICLVLNLLMAFRIHLHQPASYFERFLQSVMITTVCISPVITWVVLWIVALLFGLPWLTTLLILTLDISVVLALAAWLWRMWIRNETTIQNSTAWRIVGASVVLYTIIFTALNWGLWFSLRLPHGDSSMYEEHLWNLLHGKGFRSYLDQGLFLGEHIQVIHVLLTPLYVFWPSHLLLELCESLALASGAIPVYVIAKRHSQNPRAAAIVALAYLLYFPIHYLDISIDLKTFRPIAFGVPLLLWAIDALERIRWGLMSLFSVLALACKEDFAIVLAPLGLWLVLTTYFEKQSDAMKSESTSASKRVTILVGACLCLLATAYLLFVVKYAIPWFRSGETVHYARYFSEFGETPTEIVVNMLTKPGTLLSQFITAGSFVLFLQLLVPVGFPFRAWSQLLVGAPLFLLLCLNELAQQTPGPVHHFHAPLVPIVMWAMCTCLQLPSVATPASESQKLKAASYSQRQATWVLCCAFASCIIFSFGPLSIRFWDSGRAAFWKARYIPDERAKQFAKIESLIPLSARVASTDYVHPRFTHHERSYDYSNYLRKVSDYLPKVPDDTQYIVIDTRHPYSEIHAPSEVRELRESSDEWELLPDLTQGYFIVLKRKSIILEPQ